MSEFSMTGKSGLEDTVRGWRAQVNGKTEALKELVTQLASTEHPLIEETDGFFLNLSCMPYETEYVQVRTKAKEILDTLNSVIAWLAQEADLTLGSVDRVRDDGVKEIFLTAEAVIGITMTGSLTVLRADGTVVEPPSPYADIGNLISITNTNGAVRDVMSLWAHQTQDWVNLFRIFEIIQHETKGKPHELGCSKNQLKLFERTANSRSAIGNQARHGVERYAPPDSPMEFGTALALIRSLTQNWLTSLSKTN